MSRKAESRVRGLLSVFFFLKQGNINRSIREDFPKKGLESIGFLCDNLKWYVCL